MTSPPSGLYFSVESTPSAASSPVPETQWESNSTNRDIHLAAEALESLRSLPAQVGNSGFVLPPIQAVPPVTSHASAPSPIANSHIRHNPHKITHSYRNRHSPYHSRSSSFSDAPSISSGPSSPGIPSLDPTSNRSSSRCSSFLNPLVSSAVRVYENSKSFSPRFRVSAEKLESVISSRMANSTPAETSSVFSASPSPDPRSPSLPPIRALNTPPSQNANLSKWLVTATSLASNLSYENRQRLRYCLHLLKLANTHIASKVSQLQELLQEEKAAALAQSIASDHVPTEQQQRKKLDPKVRFTQAVNNIKKDIIWTIRKVVSALSTYAGNSLPEPARSHVRSYILRLPQRWVSSLTPETAVHNSPGPTNSSAKSSGVGSSFGLFRRATNRDPTTASPSSTTPVSYATNTPLSPSNRPSFDTSSVDEDGDGNSLMSPIMSNSSAGEEFYQQPQQISTFSQHAEIGNRVLSLANEAIDMLGSIINIVDMTLERANVWCDQQVPTTGGVDASIKTKEATGVDRLSSQVDTPLGENPTTKDIKMSNTA